MSEKETKPQKPEAPDCRELLRRPYLELTDSEIKTLVEEHLPHELKYKQKVDPALYAPILAEVLLHLVENDGAMLNTQQLQLVANKNGINISDRGKPRNVARLYRLHPLTKCGKSDFAAQASHVRAAMKKVMDADGSLLNEAEQAKVNTFIDTLVAGKKVDSKPSKEEPKETTAAGTATS